MNSISLDTGVIAEYIDLAGAFHSQAEAIFESVLGGRLVAVVAHPVLAETYYVAQRLYERQRMDKPAERALKLVEWLYKSPNITIPEQSLDLAILAGRIKGRFGIALSDAYAIASASIHKGKAVFRRRELEFARKLPEIAKEYELIFLEDY